MLNDTTGRAPAEVTRMVCVGVSRVEGSVMDQLFRIRNRHCESRAGARVRGALLYSSGWFVLWLEGPEAEVEAVLEAAALDPCAAHQKVIHRSRGPGFLSEPFAVVSTQGAEGPSAFGRRVYHFAREVELGIMHSPAEIWRYLSAPCLAAYEPGRAPDQHIALVSARTTGLSTSCASWLTASTAAWSISDLPVGKAAAAMSARPTWMSWSRGNSAGSSCCRAVPWL